MAYKLEKQFLGDDSEIKKDLEPWLNLNINNFSQYSVNVRDYNKEIIDFINNLSNYAVKTDMAAINGYLKEYEIFRKTDTKIYDSNPSGELISNSDLVISFVDKDQKNEQKDIDINQQISDSDKKSGEEKAKTISLILNNFGTGIQQESNIKLIIKIINEMKDGELLWFVKNSPDLYKKLFLFFSPNKIENKLFLNTLIKRLETINKK
jgi:uncharacterized protein YeeX (DUF496 family)